MNKILLKFAQLNLTCTERPGLNLVTQSALEQDSAPMVKHVERRPVRDVLDVLALQIVQSFDLFEVAVHPNDREYRDQQTQQGLQHDVERQNAIVLFLQQSQVAPVCQENEWPNG